MQWWFMSILILPCAKSVDLLPSLPIGPEPRSHQSGIRCVRAGRGFFVRRRVDGARRCGQTETHHAEGTRSAHR
jgi:hypothetical protein